MMQLTAEMRIIFLTAYISNCSIFDDDEILVSELSFGASLGLCFVVVVTNP